MKRNLLFGTVLLVIAISGFSILGGCSSGGGSSAQTTFYGAGR